MAEWFKASRLKRDGGNPRGFESYSLRHLFGSPNLARGSPHFITDVHPVSFLEVVGIVDVYSFFIAYFVVTNFLIVCYFCA